MRWADEVVVVVDRESRDDTEAIARRGATVVAVRAFDDFAGQRNAALALATGDWVFAVDADERVTPELAAEIRRATTDPGLGHDGYRVPIRSVILGRPFSFSGRSTTGRSASSAGGRAAGSARSTRRSTCGGAWATSATS